MQSELLSPRQLADRVGWPVNRIRRLIAKGQLHYIRDGKNYLLPSDAVESFIKKNLRSPAGTIQDNHKLVDGGK